MDKSLKKYLMDGKFQDVKPVTSKTMSSIKGKYNKSTEVKLKMIFVRNGIGGFKMHCKFPGKPDFYFESLKLAIFVDGCFWHGCPKCGHIPKTRSSFWKAKFEKNKERDIHNVRKLSELGIFTIRLWEHEISEKKSTNKLIKRILKH